MCLPSPKIPDMSAQMEAQQKALREQQEAESKKQRDAEMRQAADEARKAQRKRRGRASLISRSGGSGSLGILDNVTRTSSGLRPLGENFTQLSN